MRFDLNKKNIKFQLISSTFRTSTSSPNFQKIHILKTDSQDWLIKWANLLQNLVNCSYPKGLSFQKILCPWVLSFDCDRAMFWLWLYVCAHRQTGLTYPYMVLSVSKFNHFFILSLPNFTPNCMSLGHFIHPLLTVIEPCNFTFSKWP